MSLFDFFKRQTDSSFSESLVDDSFSTDMAATRRIEEVEFRVAAKRELARLYHRVHNEENHPLAAPINVDYSKLRFPPYFWKKD